MKSKEILKSLIIVIVATVLFLFAIKSEKETNKNQLDTTISLPAHFSSEDLGISFDYPSKYGDLNENFTPDLKGKSLVEIYIGDSDLQISAIENGWFGGEPSFYDAIYSSDYSGCEEYAYVTKNGIEGYRLEGGYESPGFCDTSVQGASIDGYLIYVFDLKKDPYNKIAFYVPKQNQQFTEELLDTLEIKD